MDIQGLEKLAREGNIAPLFFVIAARQVPGYDVKKAEHMENQYFDGKGYPITDLSFEEIEAKRIQKEKQT